MLPGDHLPCAGKYNLEIADFIDRIRYPQTVYSVNRRPEKHVTAMQMKNKNSEIIARKALDINSAKLTAMLQYSDPQDDNIVSYSVESQTKGKM